MIQSHDSRPRPPPTVLSLKSPLSATTSQRCSFTGAWGSSGIAPCTHDPGTACWRLSERWPRLLLVCTVFWICDAHAPLNARNFWCGSEVARRLRWRGERVCLDIPIPKNFDVTSPSWEKWHFPQVENVPLADLEFMLAFQNYFYDIEVFFFSL